MTDQTNAANLTDESAGMVERSDERVKGTRI